MFVYCIAIKFEIKICQNQVLSTMGDVHAHRKWSFQLERGQTSHLHLCQSVKTINQFGYCFKYNITRSAKGVNVQNLVGIASAVMALRILSTIGPPYWRCAIARVRHSENIRFRVSGVRFTVSTSILVGIRLVVLELGTFAIADPRYMTDFHYGGP